jgi:class 3 adenylate cyclase
VLIVRHERAFVDWLRHRGDPDRAAAAWFALARLPFRSVLRSEIVIAVAAGPLLLWVALHTVQLDLIAAGTLIAGMVVLQLGCGSFGAILLDICLRPIRVEIDAALPAGFAPSHRSLGMSKRITFELFILVLLPTILSAGASAPRGGGSEALARTIIAATIVTAVFSTITGLVVVERVAAPIRDLLRGTQAIADGNVNVRLPLTSTDEHLALTDSFNRMAAGLRDRQALHAAMSSYVDPSIAERVLAEGNQLTGEAADVTVMFIDIVGFTRLAENASPEQVVTQLNEFFGLVIPIIVANGGHANKLLGDGLMAVFGIPGHMPDHAERAITAARELQRALGERYGGDLRAGIGLNSGEVVAGTMGGASKLDYTIIGDVVNVAARVEALTRTVGNLILVTDATRQAARDILDVEWGGSYQLRGRAMPVGIWAADQPPAPFTRIERAHAEPRDVCA